MRYNSVDWSAPTRLGVRPNDAAVPTAASLFFCYVRILLLPGP